MADQFCRIVDTTLTDDTLGSDAAQTVITTDANTSFVVRDVNLTSSCTADNFKMKISVEMDGHSVVSGLESSVEGSLIVPPSSTVCVKDTSGNYPLTYKCLEYTFGGAVKAECCNNFRFDAACTVNNTVSGSPSKTFICQTCYCSQLCLGCGDSFEYYPYLCRSVYITGGNTPCLVWNRHDCCCTCCLTNLSTCCSKGSILNSGILVRHNPCRIFFCDFYCGCHNGGDGGTFCTNMTSAICCHARLAVSAQHPCYSGRLCRATLSTSGCGCTLFSMDVHDFDCSGSSENIMSSVPQNLGSLCDIVGTTDSYQGLYFSKEDNNWVAFFSKYSCNCMFFVDANADFKIVNLDNDWLPRSAKPTFTSNTLFIARNCICCVVSIDLDDLRANGSSATLSYIAPSFNISDGCFQCGYNQVAVTEKYFDGALACDFDIQPSGKLNMYGIKST